MRQMNQGVSLEDGEAARRATAPTVMLAGMGSPTSLRPRAVATTVVGALLAIGLSACATGLAAPREDPWVAPLLGTEPDPATSGRDLDTLLGWLGDAPLVGVGESPHGVHEHHRLVHRIFAHSRRSPGPGGPFDVLAFEFDQAHAARLDAFVQGARDDLDVLLSQHSFGSQIFHDEALAELLRWMRSHNDAARRDGTPPVHVAGYDLKQPARALAELVATLERAGPGAAGEVEDLGRSILGLGAYGAFPNVSGYTGTLEIPLPPAQHPGPRRLRASVRLRGEAGGDLPRFGHAGLRLGVGYRQQEIDQRPVAELDRGWQTLAVDLELPPDTGTAGLWLFHRGSGSVWFDDLRLEIDDEPLEPPADLTGLQTRGLMMPNIQVMDYTAAPDPTVRHPGEGGSGAAQAGTEDRNGSLRVTAHRRIAEAVAAAERLTSLTGETVAGAGDRLTKAETTWARQHARLLNQAVHWRTLVEPNRDVFLAENLTWLAETAFPGRRVLALGHASHTERVPRRMGSFLAERHGGDYRTLTLHAESGTYAYFGDVASLDEATSGLELHSVEEVRGRPLVPLLTSLGEGDLVVHLEALARDGPEELRGEIPAERGPEVAVLLRHVTPIRPILGASP